MLRCLRRTELSVTSDAWGRANGPVGIFVVVISVSLAALSAQGVESKSVGAPTFVRGVIADEIVSLSRCTDHTQNRRVHHQFSASGPTCSTTNRRIGCCSERAFRPI